MVILKKGGLMQRSDRKTPKKLDDLKELNTRYDHNITSPAHIHKLVKNMSFKEKNRRLTAQTRELIECKHIPHDWLGFRRLNMKISKKTGCLSLYGLGRIPLNLYKDQWIKLYHIMDDIITFIKINDRFLAGKDVPYEWKKEWDITDGTNNPE
jgi:hypothetical protein